MIPTLRQQFVPLQQRRLQLSAEVIALRSTSRPSAWHSRLDASSTINPCSANTREMNRANASANVMPGL